MTVADGGCVTADADGGRWWDEWWVS